MCHRWNVCVPHHRNSHAAPAPQRMALGGGASGRWAGQESRALMTGICALVRDPGELPPASTLQGLSEAGRAGQDPRRRWICWCLDLGPPAFRNGKVCFCLWASRSQGLLQAQVRLRFRSSAIAKSSSVEAKGRGGKGKVGSALPSSDSGNINGLPSRQKLSGLWGPSTVGTLLSCGSYPSSVAVAALFYY